MPHNSEHHNILAENHLICDGAGGSAGLRSSASGLLFPKEIFLRAVILGWQLFSFSALEVPVSGLPGCVIVVEKSPVGLTDASLKVTRLPSLAVLKLSLCPRFCCDLSRCILGAGGR